jgi:RNA polymerase sigma-70 factor (ECF subfamily)
VKEKLSSEQALSTSEQPTDETLVAQAREGDLEAMDRLVSRHLGGVFRAALNILGDEDAASDAAQETFLKAFRKLAGFRGEASFKTWVLAIAANEAKGILRKAGRRKELSLEKVGQVVSRENPADAEIETREDAQRVLRLLAKLPEKQKQAVTLRIFEELSFREIGKIIGSSEGAARVNYHHGIRRLKEMVG